MVDRRMFRVERFTMFNFHAVLVIISALFCVDSATLVPKIYTVFLNETIPANLSLFPVAKCCPVGQHIAPRVSEEEPGGCLPSNLVFSPEFFPYNETGIFTPGDEMDSFVAIIGDPCQYGKYPLISIDTNEKVSFEDFYLLENGSIFAPAQIPSMLMPRVHYCMENTTEYGLQAFVCFPEQAEMATANSRFSFYTAGLLISVPFLLITIGAYAITPPLRDVHGKALCCFSACLALAFFTLAILQLASYAMTDESCVAVAYIIHFSFVACFFWLNVMCIETYLLVCRHVDSRIAARMHSDRQFFYYSLWGWGVPCFLIIISLCMKLSPTIPSTYIKQNMSGTNAWLGVSKSAMLFFYVPAGLLVIADAMLFILTGIELAKYQRNLDLRRLARDQPSDREEQQLFRHLRRTFIFCLILYILMAINWSMELITWGLGVDAIAWSAFDLVNALQGILVFGLFVLRRPARTLVWYRARKLCGMNVQEPEVEPLDITKLPRNNDVLLG